MIITITSTDVTTQIDDVQVRVWEGVTDRGIPCKVFVHEIATHPASDATEFEREMAELPPPRDAPLGRVLADMFPK